MRRGVDGSRSTSSEAGRASFCSAPSSTLLFEATQDALTSTLNSRRHLPAHRSCENLHHLARQLVFPSLCSSLPSPHLRPPSLLSFSLPSVSGWIGCSIIQSSMLLHVAHIFESFRSSIDEGRKPRSSSSKVSSLVSLPLSPFRPPLSLSSICALRLTLRCCLFYHRDI